jgi:DNA end-binding protein Ku
MARPIWTGTISFGLVSVPVAMYPATREHHVSFHQFEKGTSDRIRNQRVNERTGDEVDYEDIVKGADVGGGRYVMVDPDELDAVAPRAVPHPGHPPVRRSRRGRSDLLPEDLLPGPGRR